MISTNSKGLYNLYLPLPTTTFQPPNCSPCLLSSIPSSCYNQRKMFLKYGFVCVTFISSPLLSRTSLLYLALGTKGLSQSGPSDLSSLTSFLPLKGSPKVVSCGNSLSLPSSLVCLALCCCL